MVDGGRFLNAVIADEHELFRGALADILLRQNVFESVSQASTIDEALRFLRSMDRVELLSVDCSMMMAERETIAWIRRSYPDLRMVVFASTRSPQELDLGAEVRVHGYISKSFRASQIMEAIQKVMEGGVFRPDDARLSTGPDPATHVPRIAERGPTVITAHRGLSPREIEVMRMLAQGKSNKEIARQLGLAEGTVKVHVNAVYRLLNVHNRVSALLAMNRALASGIDVPPRRAGLAEPGPVDPSASAVSGGPLNSDGPLPV